MPPIPPLPELFAILIVIFFAIGLHEFAHCKLADMAGDPTPRIYGRVTLNLTKHFEPLGTFMIILTSLSGFGIGWGRPAPMDPNKMRNPRWDFFVAVIGGPISNFLQAAVYAILFRLFVMFAPDMLDKNLFLIALLTLGIRINLALCIFNLIPLGPLDGHWLLGTFLPEKPRLKWYLWNRHFGQILLIVLIISSQFMGRQGMPNLFSAIMLPPIDFLTKFLIGAHINGV